MLIKVNTIQGLLFSFVLKSSLYCKNLYWYSSLHVGLPTTKASYQKHKSNLENRKYTCMP